MPLSNLHAEWTFLWVGEKGDKFYVDFDRIRKVDGFVYYWYLVDLVKEQNGILSGKAYVKGDYCFVNNFVIKRILLLSKITSKLPRS